MSASILSRRVKPGYLRLAGNALLTLYNTYSSRPSGQIKKKNLKCSKIKNSKEKEKRKSFHFPNFFLICEEFKCVYTSCFISFNEHSSLLL